MPVQVPPTKPRLSSKELLALVKSFKRKLDPYPMFIVGIRGYYRNSMGEPGTNDIGIYDDAIFIYSPSAFAAFNANTDPSVKRPKTPQEKGMATLEPGLYLAHKFDIHRGRKGSYPAICQRLAPVKIRRDGEEGVQQGMFGINIHKGALASTSSEGCQTLHPTQWDSFYQLARDQAIRYYGENWRKTVIPYVLLDGVS
jgi:hypothetical protein